MSFNTISANTTELSLFNPILNMPEKQLAKFRKSIEYQFACYVFPNLDPEPYSVLYSDKENTRSSCPVNLLLAALFLQEALHLSDDELVDRANFVVRTVFALHLPDLFTEPFTKRTLSRFRLACMLYKAKTGEGDKPGIDLLQNTVKSFTGKAARIMGTDLSKRRMDSSFVDTYCKTVTRNL